MVAVKPETRASVHGGMTLEQELRCEALLALVDRRGDDCEQENARFDVWAASVLSDIDKAEAERRRMATAWQQGRQLPIRWTS